MYNAFAHAEDRATLRSDLSADVSGRWQGRERISALSFFLPCLRPEKR